MRIAIVDNDKVYVERIFHLLNLNFPSFTIYRYLSVNELLMNKKDIDILLLDIEMPGNDGIAFARKNQNYANIIYVSSHSECMQDAFDANVAGFIVKNDDMDKRLIDKISNLVLKINIDIKKEYRTIEGIMHLKDSEIVFFHSEEDCIFIHTHKGQVRTTSPSLTKLLNNLSESFFLINRNEIINIQLINKFMIKTHEIVLVNDMKFKVSERKWKALLEKYNQVVNVE